ncbi:Shedu anti-phage system protein SduA domain-containing protein [Acinetobacter vivianii]|uniref:Shedu anti-phage system protein SduA domain-containing protein n=1 Tax=Acinetobacter vivianii TaxID=1776742 RepID=UPI002DB8BDB1|nr:Shedu anti-phage system protein SduA domain-containing protein [Acinetobacter vivianii]MEB6480242.1 DUF4263 domain-containing protein [Acinetobacter vivianii]MEB6658689.1 DUF4263 domain-containing protein [Acinetobacter vivianii]
MKISDFVFNFNKKSNSDSLAFCRVRYYLINMEHIVFITDLGELNFGQSVTNAIESIIEDLYTYGYISEKNITFIEHYEPTDFREDTFDIVELTPKTNWKSISSKNVLELIGENLFKDIMVKSSNNHKVIDYIKRICLKTNPFFDSAYQPSNSFIKRKIEIRDSMVSKDEITRMIDSFSNELELQKLLKKDLSIFAEAYTDNEEYICFSEFPIGDGFVDFVIFSGRSRMDVTLIEVKGANFNLVNTNHYKNFNSHISKASSQIELRVGNIFKNLEYFRGFFHNIREKAERNEKLHNSFIGPAGALLVDPNKDINIKTIIIGGRTNDDLLESSIRQNYERNKTPPIRVESWDTFIRRLKR